MKRKASLTILLLAAAILPATGQGFPGPAGSRVVQQDLQLSFVYANQAMTAIRAKDWVTAEGLIGVALQFNPSNSDALFERGVVLEQTPSGIVGAVSAWEAALSAGQWSAHEPDACRLKLAALLYRTKRYAEAVAVLSKMGTNDTADRLEHSALSLAGEGNTAEAARVLEQAVRVHPNNYRLVVERVRIDPAYRHGLAERFLTRTDIGYLPSEVLREIIIDTPQAQQKKELIDVYNLLYPPSARVIGESLLIAEKVSDPMIDQFVAAGGLKEGGLAEQLYASLKTPEGRAYLAAIARKFTGTSDLDTNRDGFTEREAVYASGRIVRLVVDDRQDGQPEFDVQFQDGVPSAVVANHDGIEYHVVYGEYPYVKSVDFTQGEMKTTYTMAPSGFSLRLFEEHTDAVGQRPATAAGDLRRGAAFAGAGSIGTVAGDPVKSAAGNEAPSGMAALPTSLLFPRLASPQPVVTRDLLFGSANTIEEDNLALKVPVTTFRLGVDGILKMESEWEKGSFRYLVEYHGKEKVLGLRDISNDGKFDVAEHYKGGKLVRLTYDPKQDGKPLFWIDFGIYPTLYWDYNGDGVPDAVEKRISPTRTLVEISTKLNGVFDIQTEEVTK